MEHKGAICCLVILGVLILAILVGLTQQGTSNPAMLLGMLVLLGILGFFFIIILIVLIIKSV